MKGILYYLMWLRKQKGVPFKHEKIITCILITLELDAPGV